MGLPEPALDALYRGGIIHDIGKIGVPDAILLKPGPLDATELVVMQAHALIGESIVSPLRSGTNLLPIIRNHHEHFDGGGYPDGLIGERIPRLARIVSVCDAFDAMVTDRPYRAQRPVAAAVEILKWGAGAQWDPALVDLFVREMPAIRQLGAA
jgi:HD-GYP domain-containing protein (c-di-GMP phosphodiesterase class II)